MDAVTHALLRAMMQADMRLYQQIMNSPNFKPLFEELLARSERLHQVDEKLQKLLKEGIR